MSKAEELLEKVVKTFQYATTRHTEEVLIYEIKEYLEKDPVYELFVVYELIIKYESGHIDKCIRNAFLPNKLLPRTEDELRELEREIASYEWHNSLVTIHNMIRIYKED